MTLRMGELFAGYGGLGLGVAQVLDVELAWVSEIEPAPSRILAHHFPDVPNHGDITTVDWSQVEPVDVLTGGFPCQDVSAAGKRAGLKPGTRTGLWSRMAEAIDQLRPALVIAENVRGLLSAEAHSAVEPCPWCVGDGPASGLRALGAVLGDLADMGYDARWCGLRAADVGAPHGRYRIFVTAWPAADAERGGRDGGTPQPVGISVGRATTARGGQGVTPDPDGDAVREQPVTVCWGGGAPQPGQPGSDTAPDAERDQRARERLQQPRRAAVAWRGEGPTADTYDRAGHGKRPRSEPGQRGAAATDPESERRTRRQQSRPNMEQDGPEFAHPHTSWGAYEPAIRRWEQTLGRLAPAPTEPGAKDQPRLSPRFVEWMQGLPDGWVTDVPGVSRNDQLKALGNGVVPKQAAEALRRLLTVDEAVRAA